MVNCIGGIITGRKSEIKGQNQFEGHRSQVTSPKQVLKTRRTIDSHLNVQYTDAHHLKMIKNAEVVLLR